MILKVKKQPSTARFHLAGLSIAMKIIALCSESNQSRSVEEIEEGEEGSRMIEVLIGEGQREKKDICRIKRQTCNKVDGKQSTSDDGIAFEAQ